MSRRKILFSVIAGLVVSLVILTGFGLKYTSKPAFCAGCHQIRPAVESWTGGGHSFVECLTCHADPGFAGMMKVKIGGLREVAIQVSGPPSKEAIIAIVPAARCLVCHKKISVQNPDLKALHSSPDVNCGPCHRQVIHTGI